MGILILILTLVVHVAQVSGHRDHALVLSITSTGNDLSLNACVHHHALLSLVIGHSDRKRAFSRHIVEAMGALFTVPYS